ncbi:MAG: hypothetical protein RMK29_13830 [Myxococcales bacterium]|nr:hypothetical protein [Myxococcota bacterium]MDW8282789.1 hypothetical protein [Myxococcales bacterium]
MTPTVLVPVLVYVLLPLLAGGCAVALRRGLMALLHRWRRRAEPQEPLRTMLAQVLRSTPSRPPLLTKAMSHPLSLRVEARLLSGFPSQALQETEQEVLFCPDDAGAFVALAKALLYAGQEDEARAALRWARQLGADEAEVDYLQARLVAGDREALLLCLRALRREPAYPEALYLCAQLARRLGFVREGNEILRRIEPLMAQSVERQAYLQDLHELNRRPALKLLRRLRLRPAPPLVGAPQQGRPML